ncbi:MAG: sugar phosphate isomerase/epimerase [Deltaproteobacteria bacterium]|nr:MAG: sugar phosphate isomerase/epimerase [Deltaproteobacteria bacterium]
MNLLLSTGTLYKKPPWIAAEIARRVGFDGIELVLGYGLQGKSGEKEIEATLKEGTIGGIHAPFYPIKGWGSLFESLKKTVDLAEKFRIPLITFHPPRWLDLEFGFYRHLKQIRDFQDTFGSRQISIAIENMPVSHGLFKIGTYFLSNPDTLLKFAEAHNLNLTLDLTHLGTRERDFMETVRKFLATGRVKNVHFSDYDNGHEHLFPGKGSLPLEEVLETLRATHYNGAITLELFPREIEGDFREMTERLSEALQFIQRGIGLGEQNTPKETAYGV